jgi:hypothetical protein
MKTTTSLLTPSFKPSLTPSLVRTAIIPVAGLGTR